MKFNWHNKTHLGFLAALLAVILLSAFLPTTRPTKAVARINGHNFAIEIARTSEERARGLSGRDSLPSENGMLFVFSQPGKHCFWMKDTRINLDILWFDENNKLVHVEPNVSPASYPHSFCPPADTRHVLELNAGQAKLINAKNGDKLHLSNL